MQPDSTTHPEITCPDSVQPDRQPAALFEQLVSQGLTSDADHRMLAIGRHPVRRGLSDEWPEVFRIALPYALSIDPIEFSETGHLDGSFGYLAPEDVLDLADVGGQEHAKRALEIAAAGGHNVLKFCTQHSRSGVLLPNRKCGSRPFSTSHARERYDLIQAARVRSRRQPLRAAGF